MPDPPLLVSRDEALGLGDHALRVERQIGVDLGRHPAGDDRRDLRAEVDRDPVGDLRQRGFGLAPPSNRLVHQPRVGGHLRGFQDQRRVGGRVGRLEGADRIHVAAVGDDRGHGAQLFELVGHETPSFGALAADDCRAHARHVQALSSRRAGRSIGNEASAPLSSLKRQAGAGPIFPPAPDTRRPFRPLGWSRSRSSRRPRRRARASRPRRSANPRAARRAFRRRRRRPRRWPPRSNSPATQPIRAPPGFRHGRLRRRPRENARRPSASSRAPARLRWRSRDQARVRRPVGAAGRPPGDGADLIIVDDQRIEMRQTGAREFGDARGGESSSVRGWRQGPTRARF